MEFNLSKFKNNKELIYFYIPVYAIIIASSYVLIKMYLISRKLKNIFNQKFQNSNTMASFDEAQRIVSQIEGGYQNMKNDPGNWTGGKVGVGKLVGTKYGISAPTLMRFLGRDITEQDMRNLDYETAKQIYKQNYWDKIGGDRLNNQSIANLIYQTAVHFGVNGALNLIKRATGVNYSPEYVNSLSEQQKRDYFNKIKDELVRVYSKSQWAAGFLRRLNYFNFA